MRKTTMMKHLLVCIPLILLAGCIEKRNNDLDDPIHVREWCSVPSSKKYNGDSIFNMVDFVFNPQDGKKSNILDNNFDVQYFVIDSAQLKSLKTILRRYLEKDKGNAYHPFVEYFRQYIGYELYGHKFVYVNLFTHYRCIGKSRPNIYKELYTEDSGHYDFGVIIIDLDLGDVVKSDFINTHHQNIIPAYEPILENYN